MRVRKKEARSKNRSPRRPQFQRAANIWFLLVSIAQLLPFKLSPTNPFATITPLSCLLFVTFLKDAYEEYNARARRVRCQCALVAPIIITTNFPGAPILRNCLPFNDVLTRVRAPNVTRVRAPNVEDRSWGSGRAIPLALREDHLRRRDDHRVNNQLCNIVSFADEEDPVALLCVTWPGLV